MTIPACEPFTAFQTVLPDTFLNLTVEYQGVKIHMAGMTYDTGIFPVQLGLFPDGMVNQWDRFRLTFTDAQGNPIGVDEEGNHTFIIAPVSDEPVPTC